MRDSLGGVVVLVIIVVFVVFVSAYMAFNVNYTKAFKMKNKIISTIEEYNAKCFAAGPCATEIKEYADEIGYKPHFKCNSSEGFKDGTDELYCYQEFKVVDNSKAGNIEKYYYRVVTRIDIQIPIIQNFFGLRILNVSGDTGLIIKK